MALRDHAIVAYAETKVMEKSDRDVFVLIGEMLESLLDSTGVEKNEIDGLVWKWVARLLVRAVVALWKRHVLGKKKLPEKTEEAERRSRGV